MNSIGMLHRATSVIVVLLFVCVTSAIQADEPEATGKQILYLHTEFLPYQHVEDEHMCYRLGREMVRQSFLIAARDQMGVPVRDGTLRESAADSIDDVDVVHLALLERASYKGWHVKLFAFPDEQDGSDQADGSEPNVNTKGLWTSEPLWEHTFKCTADSKYIYRNGAPTFAKAAESEFVSALKKAGIVAKSRVPDEDYEPTPAKRERWEQALMKVDFIAQYAVLREVHHEIAAHGESKALLSLLVRGYANLSFLTEHQWNFCSEVFAARSCLYAARMTKAYGQSDDVLLAQAYSWALIGIHSAGIRNLIKWDIDPADLPEWGKLIESYLHFDHDQLRKLADDGVATHWALRLHFALISTYRISIWEYKAGLEIAEKIPTAYGVFNNLGERNGQLAAVRLGARMAPQLFETELPMSMKRELAEIPQSVTDLLGETEKSGIQAIFRRDQFFTQTPSKVAKALRDFSRENVDAPLSWSILAYLIEEERFAHSANYLAVATNAVESSLQKPTDRLLEVNQGHRYSPYLKTFRFSRIENSDLIAKAVSEIPIEDPKPCMRRMLVRALGQIDRKQIPSTEWRWYKASRDFTMQGIVDYMFMDSSLGNHKKSKFRTTVANELQQISPNCEVAIRMAILSTKKPSKKKMKEWHSQIEKDPHTWSKLGYHYRSAGNWVSAARCYRNSLDIHPNYNSVKNLARYYLQKDDFDNWEKLYLDYLKTESIGLEHNSVRFKLAEGYIRRGLWEKAKPFAIASGSTYSGNGLQLAAAVTEGVGDWKAAEKWHKAMSTSYPTVFGKDWYLFCRRTGRGDVGRAYKLAQHYYSDPDRIEKIEHEQFRANYDILREDYESALELYIEMDKELPNTMKALMIAQLAEELGDEETRQRAFEKREKELAANEDSPAHQLASRTFQFMRTKKITSGELAEIDKLIADDDLENATKLPMMYFIGRHYSREGDHDLARKYLRPVLDTIEDTQSVRSPFRTLAGVELVEIDGVSRPDGDSLDTSEKEESKAEFE